MKSLLLLTHVYILEKHVQCSVVWRDVGVVAVLIGTFPRRFPFKVDERHPASGRHRGWPRTRWRDYIAHLSWEWMERCMETRTGGGRGCWARWTLSIWTESSHSPRMCTHKHRVNRVWSRLKTITRGKSRFSHMSMRWISYRNDCLPFGFSLQLNSLSVWMSASLFVIYVLTYSICVDCWLLLSCW